MWLMLNCHIDNLGIVVDVLQSLVDLPRMIRFSFQAPSHLFNNSLRLFFCSFTPLDLLHFLGRQSFFEQICRTLADLEWAQGLRSSGGGGSHLGQNGESCGRLSGSGESSGGISRSSTSEASGGGASECVTWGRRSVGKGNVCGRQGLGKWSWQCLSVGGRFLSEEELGAGDSGLDLRPGFIIAAVGHFVAVTHYVFGTTARTLERKRGNGAVVFNNGRPRWLRLRGNLR